MEVMDNGARVIYRFCLSVTCLVADSGYLDILNLGRLEARHPHTLSSCSLGIHSTQWLCSKGEHPKTESLAALCFPFQTFLLKLPMKFNFFSILFMKAVTQARWVLRGGKYIFPLHGKVMGDHLESKTLMQPAIFIKCNFPGCHLATQYTFLPLPHLSLKIHTVSSDHGWELCQACSKFDSGPLPQRTGVKMWERTENQLGPRHVYEGTVRDA